MRYFIANWKADKNLPEAINWIDKFLTFPLNNLEYPIVICPPYPLLYPLQEKINNRKNICLGSQDLSKYEQGTYTGEVTAKTLQGLVDYAIIGHSERINYFSESDKSNTEKIRLAFKYNIIPLLCIQDENSRIMPEVNFIVYEPPWAISKGLEDSLKTTIEQTPEEVVKIRNKLKIDKEKFFIYGGSVNPGNIKEYSQSPEIDGVLVGGASLDPEIFYQIIKLA